MKKQAKNEARSGSRVLLAIPEGLSHGGNGHCPELCALLLSSILPNDLLQKRAKGLLAVGRGKPGVEAGVGLGGYRTSAFTELRPERLFTGLPTPFGAHVRMVLPETWKMTSSSNMSPRPLRGLFYCGKFHLEPFPLFFNIRLQ